MTQELFIDANLEFEKVAAEVALPEDPNAWPNEVMQELYKQVPYIADFEPHVVMDRVDGERGFAFGHVIISNKTEIQRGVDEQATASAGVKQIRIPIIVNNRKLSPFDVFVTENSRVLPLTEMRLRAAVFRPQAFDVTSMTPGDTSMIGQLYPPYRQNYGFGGGGATMSVGMGKQGAAEVFKGASLLKNILPTIEPDTYSKFSDQLFSEQMYAALMKNASATSGAFSLLAQYQPIDEVKLAASELGGVKATVAQICKTANGYQVKAANHQFWHPVTHIYDRGQLVRAFGEKIALAADMSGQVTMAEGAGSAADLPEMSPPELIKDFGMYKVQDDKGRELVGYVFPNLIDTEGNALPMCLFTNGSESAVQGEIAGERAGEGGAIPEGKPEAEGHGCFFQVLPNGKAQATIPMTIKAHLDAGDGGGTALVCETYDGREVHVKVQPNLLAPQAMDGNFLIPEHMQWLPLDESKEVVLVGGVEQAEKTAHAARPIVTVTIRSGGEDSFSLSGIPLEKIAYEDKNFLGFDDTVFLLAGLGVTPEYAMKKMAQAYGHNEPIDVRISRTIKLAGEQLQHNEKRASGFRELVHQLRVDLLKEAAVIPDPVAVDTVLSLGFINPENLNTFVGYLPLIDEAQARMCELLIGSRLGLRDIPTSALEKAIRSTEEVLEGLKVIAFQKN